MIGIVIADDCEPTPPCEPCPTPTPPPCGEPGLSPGFWKHNVGVYLGYSPGSYSDPVGSTVVSKGTMGDWLGSLGLDLEALYEDLSTRGGGAAGAATRVGAANVFNALAGLQPY
jgi:hypothetical protein